MFASTNYLNVPGLYNFSNSALPVQVGNFGSDMNVLSAYYSADFSFKKFLTVFATGRLDKLSTLPAGKNSFFYPSFGAVSVISDYVDLPETISFLKFRGSYANVKDGLTSSTIDNRVGTYSGENYNSPYDGPSYQNNTVYSTGFFYNNQTGATYGNELSNPNLNPSETSQTEFGMDLRLLKNRIAIDAAYFISNDGPSIFSLPISSTSGYTSALVNGIKTQKKGYEISVTGTPIQIADFSWDVLANYSTFQQTLTEIYPGITNLNTFLKVGDRTDRIYGSAFVRSPAGEIINTKAGIPERLAGTQSQYLGNANPDFVFGLNNKFTYKNVSLSFLFDGRIGGKIINYTQQQTYRGGRHIGTTQGIFAEARPQDALGVKAFVGQGVVVSNGAAIKYDVNGKVTNFSELQFAPNTVKTFVQDYVGRYYNTNEGNLMSRSFGMLKEVVLGVKLPSTWFGKSVSGANISFVGRNLLYFAEAKDTDLSQYLTDGATGTQTPSVRSYGVNLNLVF
jgi:hypothetical protein